MSRLGAVIEDSHGTPALGFRFSLVVRHSDPPWSSEPPTLVSGVWKGCEELRKTIFAFWVKSNLGKTLLDRFRRER